MKAFVFGQAPRFGADREIVDRPPHPGPQFGFFHDVQIGKFERSLWRKEVPAEGVADAEPVSELADGPEGGCGAAAPDDQRPGTGGGGLETADHQSLVGDFRPCPADGPGDGRVGGGAADEHRHTCVGGLVADDRRRNTEDLFPLRGEFTGGVEFQRRGLAADDDRDGFGGRKAGGEKQQRNCEGVTDHGVDSCRRPVVDRGAR